MGKAFDGCYNVFARIWNYSWGTFFIVGGVLVIFGARNFWVGVLCMGVGVYFFWTKRWTRKTMEVIQGKDADEDATEPLPSEQSPDGSAAVPEPVVVAADPSRAQTGGRVAGTRPWRPTPPGSVSRRKTMVKNAFAFASLGFLVLGARGLSDDTNVGAYMIGFGALTLACFFVYARVRIRRPLEDYEPALPWGEFIVAVLTAAFHPNAYQVSFTTPEGAAAAAKRAARPEPITDPAYKAPVPPGSLTRRKLTIRSALLIGSVVIVIAGLWGAKSDLESTMPGILPLLAVVVAVFWLASRVRFLRPDEDEVPAPDWGDSIRIVFAEIFDFSSSVRPWDAPTEPDDTLPSSEAPVPAQASAPPAPPMPVPLAEPVGEPAAEAVPLLLAPEPVSYVAAPAPVADSPEPSARDSAPARRFSPKLLIGLAVALVVVIPLIGVIVGAVSSAGQSDAGVKRLIASSPTDGRDVTPEPPFFVVSTDAGSPRAVVLGTVGGPDDERYKVVITDKIFYSVDHSNATADSFFDYAVGHQGSYVAVTYNKNGIRSMDIQPDGANSSQSQGSASSDSQHGASTELPAGTAAHQSSQGDVSQSTQSDNPRPLAELLSQARSDGAGRVLTIDFSTKQTEASGKVWIAETGEQEAWYAIEATQLGTCYLNDSAVGQQAFVDAIVRGDVTESGSISFNKDGVTEIRAYTGGD